MPKVMANQANLGGQQKRKKPEKESEGRKRSAGRTHESIGANYFVS